MSFITHSAFSLRCEPVPARLDCSRLPRTPIAAGPPCTGADGALLELRHEGDGGSLGAVPAVDGGSALSRRRHWLHRAGPLTRAPRQSCTRDVTQLACSGGRGGMAWHPRRETARGAVREGPLAWR